MMYHSLEIHIWHSWTVNRIFLTNVIWKIQVSQKGNLSFKHGIDWSCVQWYSDVHCWFINYEVIVTPTLVTEFICTVDFIVIIISRQYKTVKYIYVSLRLRMQNWRKKWHFPPNFRNGIIWTASLPAYNICNIIIWGMAFPKHLGLQKHLFPYSLKCPPVL